MEMIKVFDYICSECDEQFERFVKESTKVECPRCGSTNTVRQVSSTGSFKFNGMGFEHRAK